MSHITSPYGGQWNNEPQLPKKRPAPLLWPSNISKRDRVIPFPEHANERIHMQPFFKCEEEILIAKSLRRWVPTIREMLIGIMTNCELYLMVDQAYVEKGKLHRRGGAHIDGNWHKGTRSVSLIHQN